MPKCTDDTVEFGGATAEHAAALHEVLMQQFVASHADTHGIPVQAAVGAALAKHPG